MKITKPLFIITSLVLLAACGGESGSDANTQKPVTPSIPVEPEKPDVTKPMPPVSQLRLLATAETSVTLGWQDAHNASGYYVNRDGQQISVIKKGFHAFTDNGLTANQSYLYEVLSFNDDGKVSEPISFKATPQANDAPEITSQPTPIVLAADAPHGYSVSQILATDKNHDPLTYHLATADAQRFFSINEQGILSVKASPIELANKVMQVLVEVSDGLSVSTTELKLGFISKEQKGVHREVYTGANMHGNLASLKVHPTYPQAPSSVSTEASFSSPRNTANWYGQRMSAYIIPPVTGDYQFWIAADDEAELLLSSTTSEKDFTKIAAAPTHTSINQWDKSPEQQSKLITLEAGKPYLLRAIMAEGSGADFVDVAWAIPEGTREIIANEFLLQPVDTENPTPISNFNWLKKSKNDILLEWLAASDNVGVDHYAVYNNGKLLKTVNGLSLELTGLTSNTRYNITVKAVDKAGNESASSQTGVIIINDIIPPSPVTQVTLTNISHDGLTVNWMAPGDARQANLLYKIYANGKLVGQTYATHYPLTALEANRRYKIQVEAIDTAGNSSELSSEQQATTLELAAGTPTFNYASFTFAFATNSLANSQVGTLSYTSNNTPAFTIESGNNEGYFAIDDQGNIKLVKALSATTSANTPSFLLTVQIKDGALSTTSKVKVVTLAAAQLQQQGVLQQVWTGISGNSINDINTLAPVSSQNVLPQFKSIAGMGDNYGQKISGYLRVPETGLYNFWIASDDGSELRISEDLTPEKGVVTARINGYTSIDNWSNNNQVTKNIQLNAGQLYYIEAMHKEGGGGDHLSVAWQGPSITKQLLKGDYLIPHSSLYPAIAIIENGYQSGLTSNGNQITIDFLLDQSAVDSDVWVYYGERDAGNNSQGWQYRIKLSDLREGKNRAILDNILPGRRYYVRIETQGAAGSSWTSTPVIIDTVVIDESKVAGEALPRSIALSVTHEGKQYNLSLTKHSVRSPHYQLLTYDERREQQFMPVIPMPEVRTYRGIVDNDPTLTVTGVVDSNGKMYLSLWGGDRLRWTHDISIKDRINKDALGNSEITNDELIIDFDMPVMTNNRLYLPQPGLDFHNNLGRITFTHNNSQFVANAGSNIINAVAQMEGHINELDYTWAQKTGLRWDIARSLIEVNGDSSKATDPRPAARDAANFSIQFQDSKNGGYCWGGGDWVGCIANYRMNWGFTHEIGHNFGLGHGEQTDNNEQIQTPSTHMGNMQAWKTTGRLQHGSKFKAATALTDPMLPATFKDYITVYQNESGSVNPLANDFDANGEILRISHFDRMTAKGGTVTQVGNTLHYTPLADFIGVDQLLYTATDGQFETTGPIQIQVIKRDIAGNWDLDTLDGNTIKDGSTNHYDLTAPDIDKITGKDILNAQISGPGNDNGLTIPLIASTKMENDALGHALLPHTLDPGHKSFTASMWFKMGKTEGNKLLIGKSSSGPNNMQYGGWEIRSTATGVEMQVSFRDRLMKDNKVIISQAASIDDEQWHHVAMVIDRENNKLQGYLDNVMFEGDLLASQEPIMAAMNSSGYGGGSPFKVGGHTAVVCAENQTENCPITEVQAFDSVKVYHKALTENEIATLFTAH
ncbi:fibronectin type III domain-containing protein [Photobacterium sanguinicancri]|uniref:fibronectin type III domain-containing protein n=1 Tax=Photobacterium sanguinicancri TaxID=875932 RepID=UPI002480F83D|nr:PA14 domain-containing protein [Photobacterium sanguinicancri]